MFKDAPVDLPSPYHQGPNSLIVSCNQFDHILRNMASRGFFCQNLRNCFLHDTRFIERQYNG